MREREREREARKRRDKVGVCGGILSLRAFVFYWCHFWHSLPLFLFLIFFKSLPSIPSSLLYSFAFSCSPSLSIFSIFLLYISLPHSFLLLSPFHFFFLYYFSFYHDYSLFSFNLDVCFSFSRLLSPLSVSFCYIFLTLFLFLLLFSPLVLLQYVLALLAHMAIDRGGKWRKLANIGE